MTVVCEGVNLVRAAAGVVLHAVRVEGLDFAGVARDDEVHNELPLRRQQQLLQLLRVFQLEQSLRRGSAQLQTSQTQPCSAMALNQWVDITILAAQLYGRGLIWPSEKN